MKKKVYTFLAVLLMCATFLTVPQSTFAASQTTYAYRASANDSKEVTKWKEKCCIATWKFIDKHSKAKDSKAKRFRACFNWLNANQSFRYKAWNAKEFEGKAWPYKMAYKMLGQKTGQCHEFACSIASIAKELGYKPYVIVTKSDHSFVEINGKYYDNMGSRFGASTPYLKNYKVFKKIKF